MKLKDIKLKTCPFCDGEGVLIHSKPDDEYNHAASGNPGRLKAINKAIELAVKGWNRRDGSKANG